jgi:hypothetical protein
MLDYCGLEWDRQCSTSIAPSGRSRRRFIAGAQPIYGSSVARWRNYEKFLGPLLQELGDLAR